MAGGHTLSRIMAGAGVALALLLPTACEGLGTGQSSQPTSQPTAGDQQQGQTPGTRQSLFSQFNVAGAGNHLSLEGVPDGANCTVTARRQGSGGAALQVTRDDSGFTVT